MDDLVKTYAQLMEKYGWGVVGVFPTKDDIGPFFTYTVGLSKWNHPELVLFGLPNEIACQLLNVVGNMIKNGEVFQHGQEVKELLADGILLKVIEFPDKQIVEHLAISRRFFPECSALQVVWPDKEGHWPWESSFEFIVEQPVWSAIE